MVNKREDIEAKIALFLKGEATPEQAVELIEWRKASKENEALYTSLEQVFHSVNQSEPYQDQDSEKEWRNVRNQLVTPTKVIPLWKRKEIYLGAAAIAVIAFIIGSLWQDGISDEPLIGENPANDSVVKQPTRLTASQTVNSFELMDKSTMHLQPGSSVEVQPGFNESQRLLSLEGSGTFDVVHDESMPFTIQVGKLNVVDVGTVFDIKSIGDTIKVVVTEGEVQLQLNGHVLNVSEGDSAFYVISKDLIDRYKSVELRQDKVFKFDGTKLSEVVSVLSEFFDRKIVVMDEEIAACPLSVTFKNESLATILDIISELLDIKVIRNNEIIGLYGESCL